MGSGAGSLLHRREGVGKGGICANEIDVYWRTIKPFPEVSCRKGKERAKITDRKNLDFLLKAVSAGKERNRLLKHLSSSVQNSDIQHAGLRCNKFVYAPSDQALEIFLQIESSSWSVYTETGYIRLRGPLIAFAAKGQ